MYAKSAIAGALLAAAPIARATGTATVSNQCSFPVYMWTVSATSSEMKTLSSGDEYSEGYLTNPNGGGVSMKIATEPNTGGAVTQFEYTLDNTLWYDISNINGWPFEKWGLSLIPSDNSCRSVLCASGVELCSQAYNQPDENWATAACTTDADMTLVLCSGQSDEKTPSPLALAVHNGHNHSHKNSHKKHKADKPDVDVNVKAAPAAPAPAAPKPVTTAVPNAAGVMTTFVTNIVTVTARDAEPSVFAEEPVRRHMHQHHHHHHA